MYWTSTLAWKAKQYDFYPEFIELAGKINKSMPFHVVQWAAEALNSAGKSTSGSKILLIGVAYKEGIADTRESPSLKVIELLSEQGAEVSYHNPYVRRVEVSGTEYQSVPLDSQVVEAADCIVILTAHSGLNLQLLESAEAPVVDTRNVLRRR